MWACSALLGPFRRPRRACSPGKLIAQYAYVSVSWYPTQLIQTTPQALVVHPIRDLRYLSPNQTTTPLAAALPTSSRRALGHKEYPYRGRISE